MEIGDDPRIIHTHRTVGDISLDFYSEQYSGSLPLDTKVMINNSIVLCWISYPEIDEFVKELEATVTKYRI